MEDLIKSKNKNPVLNISIHDTTNRLTIKLSGKIVYNNQAEAKSNLIPYFNQQGKTLIIDMNALEFVDSTGLAVIVHLFKIAETNNCKMYILSNNPVINRILMIAKVNQIVPIYKSENELNL